MTAIASRLLILAAVAIAAATPAGAASYNYLFPDGSPGFALTSSGGVANPGVLVGFNPQPDPPAFAPTTLFLSDPSKPVLVQPGPCAGLDACTVGATYGLVMSFTGFGSGVLAPIPEPERDGNTSLAFSLSGHDFVLLLNVTGPGGIASWVAFNPQPDPPASWFGVKVEFAGDPQASFQLLENNVPLNFQLATPLPAALPLFASGLGVLGFLARRRKKYAAA